MRTENTSHLTLQTAHLTDNSHSDFYVMKNAFGPLVVQFSFSARGHRRPVAVPNQALYGDLRICSLISCTPALWNF